MKRWSRPVRHGLKAVLFDLDNTLIDRDAAFEACLLEEFPLAQDRARLRRADCSGLGPREAFFELWEQLTRTPMDQKTFVSKLLNHIRPDPPLLSWLGDLRLQHKIGLISNGGKESQWSKMRAAGLHEVFKADEVWISGAIGIEKPDPRIFHLACQGLGEHPQDCLYLGDRDDVDGKGARDAGLQYQRMWRL